MTPRRRAAGGRLVAHMESPEPRRRTRLLVERVTTRTLCTTLLAGLFACVRHRAAPAPAPDPAVPPELDHVVVAIDSLDRGISLLRSMTGVMPRVAGANAGRGGGANPGVGTRSALLGLGSGRYLELSAPDPEDTTGFLPPGTYAIYRQPTPIGWALRARDADSLRASLRSRGVLSVDAPYGGSRRRPDDGATVRWRVLMPWGAVSTVLPFFVEWNRSSGPHPADDAPPGCTLVSLTLSYPALSADTLRARLQRAGVRVRVVPSTRQGIGLLLDCPTGRVQLPPLGASAGGP